MNTSQTIRKFAGKIVKKNDSQNAITLEIRESRKQTAYFNAIVPSTQYSGVSNNELTKYIFMKNGNFDRRRDLGNVVYGLGCGRAAEFR